MSPLYRTHDIVTYKGVIRMEDINVQIMDMDTMIPEHLVKNTDDSYTIFLNARLSRDSQLKSYCHALRHIMENDFQKTDVQEIESSAHNPS